MYESGAFVAEHVSPLREEQIQPNGVDLTLAGVVEPVEPGRIDRDTKRVADRKRVEPAETDEGPLYRLEPGGYVVEYAERLRVPDGHVGFVLPRSSLLRNGATLETAVWDAGYEGRGEGLLQVHHAIEIREDARIGQFVLSEADHDGTYDGSYQGERL
ncbi:MAG: deoxyuridine 5'-triphosphate nucleotidohydrolase [Halobaculum sp.]